jgi:Na+-driven multidrug efflux pump
MGAMLVGAVANVLLDPLFIFVFHWGMAGAAWATVVSQGLSCAWSLAYFRSHRANTRLRLCNLRLDWRAVVRPMLAIGFAPFAMNLANSLLNVVLNRGLRQYGGDPAVAVMGILNSYMSLIFMPVFGIVQGAQPLMGYNYGARRYARVRQFFRVSAIAATALMVLGWMASQLLPAQIMRLFVPAASPLIPVGVRALRLFTLAFPLVGFQIMSGNLFQAIGRPIPAGLLALARQILLFVPFLLVFPRFIGLAGIYLSAPASDILSFLLAWFLVSRQMRTLRNQERTAW